MRTICARSFKLWFLLFLTAGCADEGKKQRDGGADARESDARESDARESDARVGASVDAQLACNPATAPAGAPVCIVADPPCYMPMGRPECVNLCAYGKCYTCSENGWQLSIIDCVRGPVPDGSAGN